MPTKVKNIRGRTVVASAPSRAASRGYPRRKLQKAPIPRATASGSEPPSSEACHQARFDVAKYAATHVPKRRAISKVLTRDATPATSQRLKVRGRCKTSETAAIA